MLVNNEKKEPLIRITKRDDCSLKQRLIIRTISIGAAIILSILFLWIISSKNPFIATYYIISGPFENSVKIWSTLQETIILLAISLALLPAYKMRFWNIGGQGQILMGALMATIVMIYLNFLPNTIVIIIALIGAIIGGSLWGFIPSAFKAKWNTNETLFTLMMNYIAIQIVSFATENWRGEKSSMGIINMTTKIGWLANIGGNKVILPLICVILLAIFMYIYIEKTKHGYEIQVVGESVNTARYTGIKVKTVIIRTMILSGAICGIVGFFYVAGFDHTISSSTSGSYGFTAIIVCWLSHFNPLLMVLYAFIMIFLNKGAISLKNKAYSPALNEYSCELIVLIIILAIMFSEFLINYRFVIRRKESKAKEVANG